MSDELAEVCIEACKTARRLGIQVSCDLNYRRKLWGKDKAGEVMSKICKHVDVYVSNEEDAEALFGMKAAESDAEAGRISVEGYKDVAQMLAERFGFRTTAITLRTSLSASENEWTARLYNGGRFALSRHYSLRIVDRVGGGDSFVAGVIYSLSNGFDLHKAEEFAAAASALKHSVEGDLNRVSVGEVLSLMENSSGKIQR